MQRYDRHDWCTGQVTHVMLSAAAGIHVGLDALADLPLAKLRKQLDVNLIAQVSVTQVGHSPNPACILTCAPYSTSERSESCQQSPMVCM